MDQFGSRSKVNNRRSTMTPFPFLQRFRIKNLTIRQFLAEFLGTFIVMLIGDAALAWGILNRNLDMLAIVFGWAIAVMLGVSVAEEISGGHVNPAITLALATLGKMPWKKVPVYFAAQYLGSFLASCVLFITFYDMLSHFDGGTRTVGGSIGTAHIWSTYPRIDANYSTTEPVVSLGTTFLDQLVGTGLVMFTALAVIDPKNLGYPKWMHPIALGLMIAAIALCFGSNCMAPLNPARDVSSRLFTALAGYGSATFSPMNYHFWWVAGFLGPHVGAIIGGWIYFLGIELHWPDPIETQDIDLESKDLMNETADTNGKKPAV